MVRQWEICLPLEYVDQNLEYPHKKNIEKTWQKQWSLNTALLKPNCAETCLACWSCQNSTLKLHRVSNSITTKNQHTTGTLTAIRAFGHLSSKVVAIPCVWEGVLKGTDQGRSKSRKYPLDGCNFHNQLLLYRSRKNWNGAWWYTLP